MSNKLIVFFVLILFYSCCFQDKKNIGTLTNSQYSEPTVICDIHDFGRPKKIFNIIHYDENYLFVRGLSRDFVGNETSSHFVHSKKNDLWLIISKVSTKKGIFGCSVSSPTLTKEESRKLAYCSVDLVTEYLANNDYCDLPIMSGSISFPDNMFFDKSQNEYVMEYFSSWRIEKVKTVLRFKKEDLDSAFMKEYN